MTATLPEAGTAPSADAGTLDAAGEAGTPVTTTGGDPLRDHWHPVAWASELGAAPRSTMLLDERVVCWRGPGGRAVAAADRCPHRGTALSLGTVDDTGCIVCPYHGWTFPPDGPCSHIPQLAAGRTLPPAARLTPYLCAERYGIVWVCLGEPAADIPAFPEWDDDSYRHVPCDAYTWRSSPERMLENFTDFGHLGFLHDGLLGSRDDLVVPEHRVHAGGIELRYELTMEVPNTNAEFAVTDLPGERGTQTNTYVLTLPYTIHLQCSYLETGTYRTLYFAVQPRGDGTCTGYCYQSRNFELDAEDRPFALFQEVLAEQDRPIVESQLPFELPLAANGELHLPFDRVAVAYRRAMRELVSGQAAAQPAPSRRSA